VFLLGREFCCVLVGYGDRPAHNIYYMVGDTDRIIKHTIVFHLTFSFSGGFSFAILIDNVSNTDQPEIKGFNGLLLATYPHTNTEL
jgi:hypothetical protein